MGSVLLVIHLMVAILLVTLILMQNNSGNALSGLGGGNGADSFLSARGKGNLMTRTTAILATIFFITSILLVLYYKGETRTVSSITEVAPLVETTPSVPDVPSAPAEVETPAEVEAPAENSATAPLAAETPAEVPAPSEAPAPEQPTAE